MKNKYKTSIIYFLFLFSISGCDQFSRFSYESFKCGLNSTGIQEIILSKATKGGKLKITQFETIEETSISDITEDIIYFNFKNKKIEINRKDGSISTKDGNKVTVIKCEVSKFKM